jgi:cytidine deaminase
MKPEQLMDYARKAAERAYCPYSKFHVGAAVLLESGAWLTGVNVENASYGLTICAERNAIFRAITAHPGLGSGGEKIVAIAVACPDLPDGFEPKYSMPCGACRQVMSEFMDEDTPVHIDRVGTFKLKELLPQAFKL